MTTQERRCPHCDSLPTSKWVWGGEGTIWEGWWACPCGGSGPEDRLTDYDNDSEAVIPTCGDPDCTIWAHTPRYHEDEPKEQT